MITKTRPMKSLAKIINCVFVLSSMLLLEQQASAKSNRGDATTPANFESLLRSLDPKILGAEKELEERVRKILSSQLDSPYSLFIKITIDENRYKQKLALIGSEGQLRTLPSGVGEGVTRYVKSLSVEDVFSLIKSIKVSLTLDKSIPDDQEQGIKRTISAALNLNTSRGDVLETNRSDMVSASFKSKQEAFNREAQSASFQTKRMEIMLKELELQNKKISSKENDKTGESSLTMEIRRIAEDMRVLRLETEKIAEKISEKAVAPSIPTSTEPPTALTNGPLDKFKKLIAGLELPITLLPIGLILALVLLKMAGGQSQTAGALKSGLEELGKSVKAMADILAGAAKTISAASDSSSSHDKATAKETAAAALQGNSESGSLELLQADAINTWSKTIEMPYYLLSILKDWLVLAENREKFLQVTEAVGAESAAWIWSKFPAEEVEQLGPLLNKSISKASSFGSISLLYRATVREAGAKPQYVNTLSDLEFLVSLTDTKLKDLMIEASEKEKAAILSVLTESRAARIINLLGEKVTIEIFKGMETADQANVQEVERHIASTRARAHQSVNSFSSGLLGCLVRVLESQGSAAQDAAKNFLLENQLMAAEVRKRVITFEDVMSLDQDTLYELFGALSPADISSVVSNMRPEQKGKIITFFSGKAKAQIEDELKKIGSKNQLKKRAELQGEKIKSNLLRKVRTMRDQGLIEFDTVNNTKQPKAEEKKVS
jgi:hypothetical protein